MTYSTDQTEVAEQCVRRTKDRLLSAVKRRHLVTAQELAGELELSLPAVRRHLQDLQELGLLSLQVEKPGGRGRPQHVYQLTEAGERTFPRKYELLCSDVLEHIEQLFGEGAVAQVFDARRMKLEEELRQSCNHPELSGRLHALARILVAQGYEAYAEQIDGVWYLVEQNCPAVAVARAFPEICRSELELYQAVLGCALVRETRIASGAGQCRYRLEPRTEQAGSAGL